MIFVLPLIRPTTCLEKRQSWEKHDCENEKDVYVIMVTILKFLQTFFITKKSEALRTFSLLNRLGSGDFVCCFVLLGCLGWLFFFRPKWDWTWCYMCHILRSWGLGLISLCLLMRSGKDNASCGDWCFVSFLSLVPHLFLPFTHRHSLCKDSLQSSAAVHYVYFYIRTYQNFISIGEESLWSELPWYFHITVAYL